MDAPVLLIEARDAVDVSLDSDVTFSVSANGLYLLYVWMRGDGTSLATSDSRFEGIRSYRLTIRNVGLADVGSYMCVVSNGAGIIRSSASLTISEFELNFDVPNADCATVSSPLCLIVKLEGGKVIIGGIPE